MPSCKFTPLGFETGVLGLTLHAHACKFTPLGFETHQGTNQGTVKSRCKFTPLGFETGYAATAYRRAALGVNLPRWGLKHEIKAAIFKDDERVNLPRWGLKLHRKARRP